jgi:hypothetical protein
MDSNCLPPASTQTTSLICCCFLLLALISQLKHLPEPSLLPGLHFPYISSSHPLLFVRNTPVAPPWPNMPATWLPHRERHSTLPFISCFHLEIALACKALTLSSEYKMNRYSHISFFSLNKAIYN